MQGRLIYIDLLKGIAILLVVIGHVIQYNFSQPSTNPLYEIIYSFHMPLFMFLSGYVGEKSIKLKIFDSYFKFLKKKSMTLLLPFFSWALIVNFFFFKNAGEVNLSQFKIRLIDLLKNPSGGLWFLWFLFLLTILYTIFIFLTSKIKVKKGIIADVTAFILVLALLLGIGYFHVITYANSLILYYFFFFIGVFTSKYIFIKKMILNVNVFTVLFISFIVLSGYYAFGNESIWNLLLKIFLSICAIYSLYYLVSVIEWNQSLEKYISVFGRNSLIIYVTHFKLVKFASSVILIQQLSLISVLLISIISSLIIIFFCLFIANIISYCPPLNLLLYGALPNHKKDVRLEVNAIKEPITII